jgi:hypothetical protein
MIRQDSNANKPLGIFMVKAAGVGAAIRQAGPFARHEIAVIGIKKNPCRSEG